MAATASVLLVTPVAAVAAKDGRSFAVISSFALPESADNTLLTMAAASLGEASTIPSATRAFADGERPTASAWAKDGLSVTSAPTALAMAAVAEEMVLIAEFA